MAVEHAAENQVRKGERSLRRIADYIGEVVRRKSRPQRASNRMNEDHGAQGFGFGPKNLEPRISQLGAVDRRRYDDALEIKLLHRMLELFSGEFRELQRDAAQTDEATRTAGADRGNSIV